MRVDQKNFLINSNMNANITSNAIQLNSVFGFAIQANYATVGTLGGTFKLQVSVDHREDERGNVLSAGNWVDMADSSVTISGSGNYIWNVNACFYPWVRLVYTKAGPDTGTLNAWFYIRGF